jgi:mannose-1-phosphate guanylyltransferase
LLANAAFAAGEPVMLVHADNLCGADLGSFIGAHARRAAGVCMTMMSFYADTPQNCGILELDAAGLVRGFYEKVANPPHHNANAAVYIVDPDVIDFAAGLSRTTLDFSTEVIPRFLGRIQVWHNRVYHRDIGTLASLFAAQEEYPAAAPALDLRPDPWHELCLANNWELADRLASALAAALALPEVRGLAPALPGPALHHLRESGELDRLRPGAPEAPGPGSALLLDKAAPDGAVRCQEIIGRAWRYLVLCATHAQRSDGKAC